MKFKLLVALAFIPIGLSACCSGELVPHDNRMTSETTAEYTKIDIIFAASIIIPIGLKVSSGVLVKSTVVA